MNQISLSKKLESARDRLVRNHTEYLATRCTSVQKTKESHRIDFQAKGVVLTVDTVHMFLGSSIPCETVSFDEYGRGIGLPLSASQENISACRKMISISSSQLAHITSDWKMPPEEALNTHLAQASLCRVSGSEKIPHMSDRYRNLYEAFANLASYPTLLDFHMSVDNLGKYEILVSCHPNALEGLTLTAKFPGAASLSEISSFYAKHDLVRFQSEFVQAMGVLLTEFKTSLLNYPTIGFLTHLQGKPTLHEMSKEPRIRRGNQLTLAIFRSLLADDRETVFSINF